MIIVRRRYNTADSIAINSAFVLYVSPFRRDRQDPDERETFCTITLQNGEYFDVLGTLDEVTKDLNRGLSP